MGKVPTIPKEIYSEVHGKFAKSVAGDVEKIYNADSVSFSIRAIIKTRPGERVMLPEFGSNLDWILFEPIDKETAIKLAHEIKIAIERWEDRVQILTVRAMPEPENNKYTIHVDYFLRALPNTLQRLSVDLITLHTS